MPTNSNNRVNASEKWASERGKKNLCLERKIASIKRKWCMLEHECFWGFLFFHLFSLLPKHRIGSEMIYNNHLVQHATLYKLREEKLSFPAAANCSLKGLNCWVCVFNRRQEFRFLKLMNKTNIFWWFFFHSSSSLSLSPSIRQSI